MLAFLHNIEIIRNSNHYLLNLGLWTTVKIKSTMIRQLLIVVVLGIILYSLVVYQITISIKTRRYNFHDYSL